MIIIGLFVLIFVIKHDTIGMLLNPNPLPVTLKLSAKVIFI